MFYYQIGYTRETKLSNSPISIHGIIFFFFFSSKSLNYQVLCINYMYCGILYFDYDRKKERSVLLNTCYCFAKNSPADMQRPSES